MNAAAAGILAALLVVRAVESAVALVELVGALKKLCVQNLSNLTPHPWHVALHYSHPPLLQRIAAIRAEPEER